MHCKNWLALAACAGALVAGSPASAQVNVADKTTHVTFNTPVELPGLTLPPGTYTLRLQDHNVNRHIVQVYDRDGKKLGKDILAMAARRLERTEDTVITFYEVPADVTPPVRYWYYPNDLVGEEFAYPREQALRIANATRRSVLAVDGEQMVRVEPESVTAATQAAREPVTTVPQEPAREPVTAPPPEPQIAVRDDEVRVGTTGRRRLPQTSSALPLVGLLGLWTLGGGLALRAYRLSRD